MTKTDDLHARWMMKDEYRQACEALAPLATKEEYDAAMDELETLMDAEPGTLEAERLEVLGFQVWSYELKHHPIDKPHPIAVLEYYIESRGLMLKDLGPFIGSTDLVSEVMNKRRHLSQDMIRKLEEGTGIPANVLSQPYELESGAGNETS